MSVRATARRVPWSRTDVRLRAWVDQIWLPFVDDDDSPGAVTMGAAPRAVGRVAADRARLAGPPLIQRDYAQGRPGRRVVEIRTSFLGVLHGAISGGDPVGLDFIYGDVDEDGTLLPLDGQQRLTTLFLLHWYLCVRAGSDPAEHGWSRFSYDTRASARRFCERIVANPPPQDEVGLADWVVV